MGGQERATKILKISEVKNALSGVMNEVLQDSTRVLVEKHGIPDAAIISVNDLKKLVHFERINRNQGDEDPFAVIDRMREAFKGLPDDEIEREADRAIAGIRAKDRAAREALAAAG